MLQFSSSDLRCIDNYHIVDEVDGEEPQTVSPTPPKGQTSGGQEEVKVPVGQTRN